MTMLETRGTAVSADNRLSKGLQVHFESVRGIAGCLRMCYNTNCLSLKVTWKFLFVQYAGHEEALLEEEAAKELPPWLRGEAWTGAPSASSAGRSEDSTGTAAPQARQKGHPGQQQQQQQAGVQHRAGRHPGATHYCKCLS